MQNLPQTKIYKKRTTVKTLMITVPACLLALAYSLLMHKSAERQDADYFHTDEIPVAAAPANTPVMTVLFVGNSYTMVNDLPGVIANIAATDTATPVTIRAGRFLKPGTPLSEHWDRRAQADPLSAGRWDYVVLQDSSMLPVIPSLLGDMKSSTANWVNAVRQTGSRPVLYEAWARQPGSSWYKTKELERFKTPEQMQDEIDRVINGLGASLGAMVVPVGDYWMACMSQAGAPNLYMADGTHPSPAGTYLTALVFYRKLTGHELQHVTYVPPNLSQKDAAFILRCASY